MFTLLKVNFSYLLQDVIRELVILGLDIGLSEGRVGGGEDGEGSPGGQGLCQAHLVRQLLQRPELACAFVILKKGVKGPPCDQGLCQADLVHQLLYH
jgi:hypothetical protein